MNETFFVLVPKNRRSALFLDNVAGTNRWVLYRISDKVYFSNKKGPWLFLNPTTKKDVSIYARWINYNDDEDFYVYGAIPEDFENRF